MRIYTLIAALALCLVAVCLWAETGSERVEVKKLPDYLRGYAGAGRTEHYGFDTTLFELSKKSLAGSKIIRVSHQSPIPDESGFVCVYRPDKAVRTLEKHMDSRITEYPLVEAGPVNKDYDLEIYRLEKDRQGLWGKSNVYLLVLRRKGKTVWFDVMPVMREISRGKKFALARPDAILLPDGRSLVVSARGGWYSRETAGKLVLERAFAEGVNWIGATESKTRGSYMPPSAYPEVRILTDNIVRYSYPDGCAEHWALKLSGEDTARNKSRLLMTAGSAGWYYNCKGRLLWWNGICGRKTRECAEESAKVCRMWCFKKSVWEPVYNGRTFKKKEGKPSELFPRDVLENAKYPVLRDKSCVKEAVLVPQYRTAAERGRLAAAATLVRGFFAMFAA